MASRLFSPLSLRSLKIRNRIFVSPMCQYSAKDGLAGNWHLVHLGARAVGGAGLVMAEATAVSPEGRISPFDLGLWNDEQAEAFRPITEFLREHGAIAALQLAHAGRKASTAAPWLGGAPLHASEGGWTPIAPSPLAWNPESPSPVAIDDGGLQRLREAFVAAARRAARAGFQVLEIHAAHGYLLHEFLSPLTNRRSDIYGGSFINRIRFPLEVISQVRVNWPEELPLFVRLSATDWVEGGWTIDDSVQFSQHLRQAGVDLVDCSSGGIVPKAHIPVAPGFQVPFSERIRREVGILTGAVGGITEAHQAEAVLADERADAVFLARELLRDPQWPLHAARELGVEVEWPRQYLRAKK